MAREPQPSGFALRTGYGVGLLDRRSNSHRERSADDVSCPVAASSRTCVVNRPLSSTVRPPGRRQVHSAPRDSQSPNDSRCILRFRHPPRVGILPIRARWFGNRDDPRHTPPRRRNSPADAGGTCPTSSSRSSVPSEARLTTMREQATTRERALRPVGRSIHRAQRLRVAPGCNKKPFDKAMRDRTLLQHWSRAAGAT